MNGKGASGYAKFEAKPLQWLLNHPFGAIAMHWMFQSLFYVDSTERWFKLTLDAILTALGGLILSLWSPTPVAWLIAFLVAHTLNFFFNGQLWGVLKHFGMVNHTYEAFESYAKGLIKRAQGEPAIQHVIMCGSVSRQEWSSSSDLDARIVRYPGFVNGLRACWFLSRERSRALVAGFPLDVYIVDDEISLRHLNPEETRIYISETGNAIRNR